MVFRMYARVQVRECVCVRAHICLGMGGGGETEGRSQHI